LSFFTKRTSVQGGNWYDKAFPYVLDWNHQGYFVGHDLPLSFADSFANVVPIYDASKEGFNFDKTAFDNLRSLPAYRPSRSANPGEVPQGFLVTVGFTINSFPTMVNKDGGDDNQGDLYLSLNLQFVIVLGNPSK